MSESKKQTRRASLTPGTPKTKAPEHVSDPVQETAAIEAEAERWFRYPEAHRNHMSELRLLVRAILQSMTPEQRAEVLRKVKL
jgi:hypothetical protein